jgi:PleD family two-component response regulator
MMKMILIIDDAIHLNQNLKVALSQLGDFILEQAYTGEDGVSKAIESQPHLIILDADMPDLRGWSATKLLRSNERTRNIPILGFTSWASLDEIKEGIFVGIDDFLVKPFNLVAWQDKLESYLID